MLQNVKDVKIQSNQKVSEQWFVNMKGMAKRAADSVRNGKTKFVPQKI